MPQPSAHEPSPLERLCVTGTETSGAGGVGSATCRGDSAIGLATSAGATGPWVFSDAAVVAPRRNAGGCDCSWTYDPDVLGDTVGATSTSYDGSCYGGVFGAPVTFTPTGATTGASTQVAIGNRYEGANVVLRDGHCYPFASAANCCSTSLTGYSAFVGRSTNPLGPFLDREGNSILAGRVGSTPVISMNGNRWVGTGHDTVFEDAGGQWWTVYHAVDEEDPILYGGLHRAPSAARPDRPGRRVADRPRRAVGVRRGDAGSGRAGGRAQPLPRHAGQAAAAG